MINHILNLHEPIPAIAQDLAQEYEHLFCPLTSKLQMDIGAHLEENPSRGIGFIVYTVDTDHYNVIP
jgi:hypothetical protein